MYNENKAAFSNYYLLHNLQEDIFMIILTNSQTVEMQIKSKRKKLSKDMSLGWWSEGQA